MERFEPLTLRQAARRTGRSVTTLRRYIRAGRLRAELRPGRFGPEYFVSTAELSRAGVEPLPAVRSVAATENGGGGVAHGVATAALDRLLLESVPVTLFQDLQMKHEQLLVQYGMMRASGLRALELQHEIEARRAGIDAVERERDRLGRDVEALRQQLRQTELEVEGREMTIAALREKVRALEMLTRNAVTNESIERRFQDVMTQSRRVEELSERLDLGEFPDREPWPDPGAHADPDH